MFDTDEDDMSNVFFYAWEREGEYNEPMKNSVKENRLLTMPTRSFRPRSGLFDSIRETEGGMDNLNSKMDMGVQNLKDEMTKAFGKEGQRKKDNETLRTRMEAKSESERWKVQDVLVFMEDDETIKMGAIVL